MRFIKRMFWTVIILLAVIIVFRDVIVKWSLCTFLRSSRNVACSISNCHVTVWPLGIELKGVRLSNPPDFKEAEMIHINYFKMALPWTSLWDKTLLINELTLDIPDAVIIRNENGITNIKQLARTQNKKAELPRARPNVATGQGRPKEKTDKRKLKLAYVHVIFGKFEVKDYWNHPDGPQSTTISINLDRTYKDMMEPSLIGMALMVDIAARVDPDALKRARRLLKSTPAERAP